VKKNLQVLGLLALMLSGCVSTTTTQQGTTVARPSTDAGNLRERARIHTELGALYYSQRQLGVAIEELKVAIVSDADYGPAYNVLGLVYMELRDNEQARQHFERAIRLSPEDSDVNNNYGWFLCQTGAAKASIQYFLNAVKNPLYQTPQKAYLNAGLCSARMEDSAGADDFFQRALRIDPNMAPALLNLALLNYRRGNLAVAKTYAARLNKAADPTAESLWLALRIERKLGDRGAEASLAAQLRRNFSGSHEFQELQKGNFE
jgi:type IV pilus assembly protein PilF